MDELDAGAVREGEAAGSPPPARGRFAFVIPLFDHGRTVREVVEQARSLGFPVFVVDDGSTDGGAGSLEGLDGVTVLRHPVNLGKGAALRTGFAAAVEVAEWAITVDADGQHDPRQATELIAAIRDGERPLVVGRREGMDRPDIPWKSRFGRKFSNFWVRASGGHAVLDTQTGFRIYPLPETLELGARSNRFQFEVEILVLARRHGFPAVEVPVAVTYSPPGGRVTHYRPWIDFWRNAAVFGRFITARMLGLGRHAAVRWWLLALVVAALGGAALLARDRLHIETDIAASIPGDDPVLAAARGILADHPALDRIALDLSFADGRADREGLAAAGERLAERVRRSGLFSRVGLAEVGTAMAGLAADVVDRLPTLFTSEDLARDVAPRLEPGRIAGALRGRLEELAQLDGVGQAEAVAKDPLGLRELVLARLGALLPAGDAHVYRGQLLSGDDRHLLLLVHPAGRATDTATAARLRNLFGDLQRQLAAEGDGGPEGLRLAAVGGFRAALDNERTIRGDTQRAMWIATVGIALLLLACFPRPLLGLLALVPAAAGVVLALVVYSLLRPGISALALGFGAALVSITVDQGIAYLLYLDRKRGVTGREAGHEIWSAGLFATITTSAAFLALAWSGYPLLEQLGLFAGFAVAFAFLFLHGVFPSIFPRMPAARRGALLPVERWLTRATTGRGWAGPIAAAALAVGFLLAGRPPIVVDLQAMNHVSPDTLADEALVKRIWGDVLDRVVLAAEAPTREALQAATDRAAAFVEREQEREAVGAAFVPSEVMPGADRAAANLDAWRGFWTAERTARLRADVERDGAELGFTPEAFSPFFDAVESPRVDGAPVPPSGLEELFGLSEKRDGTGRVWLGTLAPGRRYEPSAVFAGAAEAGLRMFDPRWFAQRLGMHLDHAFRRMLALIGGSVVLLVVVLFLGLRTVLLTLAPLAFALVVTLGSLNLLGLPLDVPALLLAVVVFGMGVDYAIYFVRTSQRLLDERHPSFGPMRLTVFLAAASTLLGMASLAFSEHPVLRSAGVTGAIGVASAALGAFLILPPFLGRMFPGRTATEWRSSPGEDPRRTVARRFAGLDPHARLFAWFKLRVDPMFPRLHELVGTSRTVLDVGCGQGVPGAWLLAKNPSLTVHGVEPDPERARTAARVFGPRGTAECAAAPVLPATPARVDAVLVLDVIHHLTDEELRTTLRDLLGRLTPGGRLVLRTTVPGAGPVPWLRRLETWRIRRAGRLAHFRTADELRAELEGAGFAMERVERTAPGWEELWFVAGRRVDLPAGAGAAASTGDDSAPESAS